VRYDDPLRARFNALKGESVDPHARGRDLERVVAELFDRAGFDVVANPGAAHPRQTDIYAKRHGEAYLVEVKWRNAPLGAPDIDELRARLQRQPSSVIGVIMTMGVVGDAALSEIERERATPILVVDEREIDEVVGGTRDLRSLLEGKYTQLTVHGRASGSPPRTFVRSTRDQTEPPAILGVDGSAQPWVQGAGDYYDAVWALDLGDIDWVTAGGAGVSFDFPVRVGTLDDVRMICDELAALNWLTHGAAWTIQQSEANWHGLGRESMLVALAERGSRYAGLSRVHHREVLVATDTCPGGWYTLVADLDARSARAYQIDISIQMIGVPLDSGELKRLLSRLGVADESTFFRPRTERSVTGYRLPEPVEVRPSAWILEHEPDDARDPWWTRGIALTNPITEQADALPVPFAAGSTVVAGLRSWHTPDRSPNRYLLERIEWAWSSDAVVVRAMADWPDDAASE
jgi:Zn-finger nucleic acid-binding protein